MEVLHLAKELLVRAVSFAKGEQGEAAEFVDKNSAFLTTNSLFWMSNDYSLRMSEPLNSNFLSCSIE